jgi:hypothetical protein
MELFLGFLKNKLGAYIANQLVSSCHSAVRDIPSPGFNTADRDRSHVQPLADSRGPAMDESYDTPYPASSATSHDTRIDEWHAVRTHSWTMTDRR